MARERLLQRFSSGMTGVIRKRGPKSEILIERQGGAEREVRMSSMDTFRHLRDDHARILSELDVLTALAEAPSPGPREIDELRGLILLLERECAAHMRTEEEALFPALAETEWMAEAAKCVAPLQAEHAELKDMLLGLAAVLAAPAGRERDEQIAVQTKDLADLFRIHVRKEEALIYRMAEQVLPRETLVHLANRLLVHAPHLNRRGSPS
ncbi:MAG TPA: hemerythrin domain-containing protein [Candidatus Eisenbacteria bacterium]|nr:hemerythrin domain-containing protein [Candidatus Eisenbacteria bacterium]